jgi:hypothetical protein
MSHFLSVPCQVEATSNGRTLLLTICGSFLRLHLLTRHTHLCLLVILLQNVNTLSTATLNSHSSLEITTQTHTADTTDYTGNNLRKLNN